MIKAWDLGQGRAAWDRQDIPYLPKHKAIADAKPF